MTDIVITGVGRVRPDRVARALDTGPREGRSPGTLAHQVSGFAPEERLGRKVARFNSRATLFAMDAAESAMADARLTVTDDNRDRTGIAVGTTVGSIASTVTFGWDSFNRERPYVVNAALFPNTVLNTTAGALAIRTGMRGANSTVAGGPLAALQALRHAQMSLSQRHTDSVLAGAAEEVTGASLWWWEAAFGTGPVGEGAAMFVLKRGADAQAVGRRVLARLGSVVVRAADPREPEAVGRVARLALDRAGLDPADVRLAVVRTTGDEETDTAQHEALTKLLGTEPVYHEDVMGDCYSAHSALQMAWLLEREPSDRGPALVVAVDPEGAVGAVVLDQGGVTR
ncbi:beta-ketoacyl synthase N-terminal-like domain-containing protein [Streptomyces sp. NPDC058486]|uniref:beta-ketoacyl synthase N-terminal-like domain-containing protein n=1 Tax=unclassified Streptomyces TaxID=2593676 RepID=UPI00365533FC